MKNTISTRKELTVLKIEEEVFDFRHSEAFRSTIEELVNKENIRNLIVDFSHVKAIDSRGISSILRAHQLANQSNGLAIFVSLCKQIKDLLKHTNLDKQLYIFSSINEVMTLIEPAIKNKRASRAKNTAQNDEMIDELIDEELDIIESDEITPGDTIDEEIGDDDDDDNKDDKEKPEEQESKSPGSKEAETKKRGRPKKQ